MSAAALPDTADAVTPGRDGLRRLRWAVRVILTLGVAASIAANVLHARPNLISQLIAAWPPLALLLTVELISRIPADRRALAVLRLAATAVIAWIAAWVSYWHMAGVAAHYGETGASPYLLPLSVDGLVIVASISLVEIAARSTSITTTAAIAQSRVPTGTAGSDCGDAAGTSARSTVIDTAGTQVVGASHARGKPTTVKAPAAAEPTARPAAARPAARRGTPDGTDVDHDHTTTSSRPRASVDRADAAEPGLGNGEVPSDTAAAVAYWRRHQPSLHPAEIAAGIDRSERTVRRHWLSQQ